MSQELEAMRAELRALREAVQELSGKVSQPERRLFSYVDASVALSVSTKTIHRMVANGELTPVFIKNKPLITAKDIDRLSSPPVSSSSGASEERTRFDGAAALAKLKELRKKR